jgi:succinate-semialdehyde dehydrogenase / glutarate-semialdehyde dehydrogenase
MSALAVDDPTDDATDVGPLATETDPSDMEELVGDAVAKGATLLCGGKRLDRPVK